jgi:hypothetical protein
MRWPCSCLLAAALLAAGAVTTRHPSGAAADDLPGFPPRPAYQSEFRGAGSCAAAACHNGNGAPGEKGSEYSTWVVNDKHTHAFEVLSNEQSLRIEKNRPKPTWDKAGHPETDALCLNCHVMPGIEPLAAGGDKPPRRKLFGLDDGVSCEACHGAAGGWLTQHYTAAWRDKTPEQKEAAGMKNTKDLGARAEMCVRCHVGNGDIDVNHDLIAAGHPRLAFEYAAFHANMPKHWDVRKDKEEHPDFEAHLWALGQAVSAKAALELLAHRADEKNKRPWPEFAEYDCFACHHDIQAQSWRRDRTFGDAPPGTIPWGTWYYSLVAEAAPGRAGKDVQTGLDALAKEMMSLRPDRTKAATRAKTVAELFGKQVQEADGEKWDAQATGARLRQVAADGRQVSAKSWDGAAQVYLALVALRAARADLDPRFDPTALKPELLEMRCLLSFPTAPATGPWYDSPRDFSPVKFRQALESARRGLPD